MVHKRATYTSLMVLDSPRNRDSGGIHFTGRRAFVKEKYENKQKHRANKQKQTILKNIRYYSVKCCWPYSVHSFYNCSLSFFHSCYHDQKGNENKKQKVLPVTLAHKCRHLRHVQDQSLKFCILFFHQQECYEQPNRDEQSENKKLKDFGRAWW